MADIDFSKLKPVDVPPPAAPSVGAPAGGVNYGGLKEYQPPAERGWLGRTYDDISEAITGTKRTAEPDAGEAVNLPGDQTGGAFNGTLKAAVGYAFASDPKVLQKILVQAIPGATAAEDANGNPMLVVNGKRLYVNKPGMSGADIAGVIGLAASTVGFGKLLGWLSKAAGVGAKYGSSKVIPTLLRSGVETAAGGAAGDVIAKGLSGDEKAPWVDPTKALIDGIAGGAGGVIIPRVVGAAVKIPLVQKLLGLFRSDTAAIKPDGTPTTTFQAVLRAAGIDASQLTPETLRDIADEFMKQGMGRIAAGVRKGDANAGREAQAIVSDAISKGEEIPLTTGQRSGDLGQIATEQRMRERAYGVPAAETMRDFGATQREAVKAAVDRRAAAAAGGTAPANEMEVGQRVVDSLRQGAGKAQAATDAAYKAASDAADQAGIFFTPKNMDRISVGARNAIADQNMIVNKELTPAAQHALDLLDTSISSTPGKQVLSIKQLEGVRQQINQLFGAVKNPSDKRALTLIKNAFDKNYGDIIDEGLASGQFSASQQGAVDLLKQARAARRAQGEVFEARGGNDRVGKMIEGYIDDPNVNYQGIVNDLFGAGNIGAKKDAVELATRLQKALDPDAWNAVRGGVIKRIVLGNANLQARDNAGWQKIANSIDDALTGSGRQFVEKLLTPEERAGLSQIRYAIGRMIVPPGVANTSGTSGALMDIMRKMASGGLLGGGLGGIAEVIAAKLGMPMGGMIAGPVAAAGGVGGAAARNLAGLARAAGVKAGKGALPVVDRLHLGKIGGAAGALGLRGLLDEEQP